MHLLMVDVIFWQSMFFLLKVLSLIGAITLIIIFWVHHSNVPLKALSDIQAFHISTQSTTANVTYMMYLKNNIPLLYFLVGFYLHFSHYFLGVFLIYYPF